MKRYCLPTLLVLSLALNAGVLGIAGAYFVERWVHPGPETGHTMLVEYLDLTDTQRRVWHEKERAFMSELTEAWEKIRGHREKMIREIFSDSPSRTAIERQRAAISRLQRQQQEEVIEQLMAEREILEPPQRAKLAELLIQQNPVGSLEEVLVNELHRP